VRCDRPRDTIGGTKARWREIGMLGMCANGNDESAQVRTGKKLREKQMRFEWTGVKVQ